ncbi:MAG: dihydrofolate reductase [Gammaproteobacteria bacterium]|nr:dihydrofolate reductase [Gammaproteobacteria bacterium]
MTRARVIGKDGKLPWHYPADLRRFKQRTMGCAVIMGRVTWESLGNKPLPGRRNIVISRAGVAGVECYDSIATALKACGDQDVWFIGGAQIYQAAMGYVDLLDVTFVPDVVEGDDLVRFPRIDPQLWKIVEETTVAGDARLQNLIYRRV